MKKPIQVKIVISKDAGEANSAFFERSHYVDGIKTLADDAYDYFAYDYVDELIDQEPELEYQAQAICDSIIKIVINRVENCDYEGAIDVIYGTAHYNTRLQAYIEAFVCRTEQTIEAFATEFARIAENYCYRTDFSCDECEGGYVNGNKSDCHM